MQLKFIGTGSGKTSLKRFHSSLFFTIDREKILIDSGDGISKALLKQNISWNSLDEIIITHFHADHLAGLPSLLTQMIIEKRNKPLKIYTHSKLISLLEKLLQTSFLFKETFSFKVSIVGFEFNKEIFISENFSFLAKQNSHIINKHNIKNPNISFISASFLFKVADKKIIYTSDIGNKNDFLLFENINADYFISETTHIQLTELEENILKQNHKSVILTHISDSEEEILHNFAKRLNNSYNINVILAEDGMNFAL